MCWRWETAAVGSLVDELTRTLSSAERVRVEREGVGPGHRACEGGVTAWSVPAALGHPHAFAGQLRYAEYGVYLLRKVESLQYHVHVHWWEPAEAPGVAGGSCEVLAGDGGVPAETEGARSAGGAPGWRPR